MPISIDRVAGFLWLLRARTSGALPPCRLYGPPGIGDRIAGFVSGIAWDRIEDMGPEFHVADVYADRLTWLRIKAGREPLELGDRAIADGVLLEEAGLRVSAIELDRGIPVLSFALEMADRCHLRKDRLTWMGLEPGARACGEIAAVADVESLVPFHFSKRYQGKPERVYAEIRGVYRGNILEATIPAP